MGEAKWGEEFITHEYDEAISIHQAIVDAEAKLAKSHPIASARDAIKTSLGDDRDWLAQLKRLGKPHGATGKREDVSKGLCELLEETVQHATEEGTQSEFYEAHAVLLTLKRKQMDSATAMRRIATATKDEALKKAATEFGRGQRSASQDLCRELAKMARGIATKSTSEDGSD